MGLFYLLNRGLCTLAYPKRGLELGRYCVLFYYLLTWARHPKLGLWVLCNLLAWEVDLGREVACSVFFLPSSVGGGPWLLWVVGSVLPLRVGSGTWVLSSVYFYCQRELWTLVWILGSVWFYLPTWVVTLA